MAKLKGLNQRILTGRIVRGAGKASYFTELDWVQQQCKDKLHFRPYPGTLNIEVDEDSLPVLQEMQRGLKIELQSPDPNFCNALSVPVSLCHVRGAIIIPAKEVNIHDQNIIEMIAPVSLKETLSLQEGDKITLQIVADGS